MLKKIKDFFLYCILIFTPNEIFIDIRSLEKAIINNDMDNKFQNFIFLNFQHRVKRFKKRYGVYRYLVTHENTI